MSEQLGKRKPAVTIYDVARAAGVSPSTVSRALNKPGRINAKTESRIREVAQGLGYKLNPMARSLPTGRTRTLALLLSDITNPVYFDLVRGAERVTATNGYTLVLAESQESAEVELATAERLSASVDGIVLVASRLDDASIRTLANSKPLVIVNRRIDGIPDVTPDVSAGLRDGLDHLHALGHRRLGYVSGPPSSYMNAVRWQTVFDRAVERGMSIVEIAAGAPTLEGGATALDRISAAGVTAVFTYNDLMAMGLLRTCREAGIDVPGDLSVIGFDDIFGSDLVTPALTTVRSPLGEVGAAAVGLLISEVEDREFDESHDLLTRFVERATTGAPRA